MDTLRNVIYWASYAYFTYLFMYAALWKVLQKPDMMSGMESLGYNKMATLTIGAAEMVGVVILLLGLYKPALRNLGVLILFPFAVAALSAHLSHRDYSDFYDAMNACILAVVLLATDQRFSIVL